MGRSIKKGIDYFSHDVNMLNDRKMKLLKAKHGLIGYAIYLRLLEMLYDENGYYLKIDDEFNILFIDDNNINENVYINVLNDCINYKLFDKNIYDTYSILTSKRIQHNYFSATERRKSVDILESLLLTEIINDNINLINDNINPQRKEKEIKEEKKKEYTLLEIAINDFIDFRKKVKKPMTKKAIELLHDKLNNFAKDDETKIKILNKSILSGWTDVYELNSNNGYGKKQSNKIEPSQATKERYGEA